MNRRGFLKFLLQAPIVGASAIRAIQAAQPYIVACARPFVSDDIANRWATKLWLDLPREIYWSKFMRNVDRGTVITLNRVRKIPEPKDS